MSLATIRPIPAVNAVIFNRAGELLLTRRSPSIREPGKWCLPGGHLDFGEDWSTGIRREVQEEVGLTVKRLDLLGIYSDPLLTVTEPLSEGYRAQFVVALFLISEYAGEVAPNSEVDKWGWFGPQSALPEPMMKSHPVRVRDAFAFRGEVFVR